MSAKTARIAIVLIATLALPLLPASAPAMFPPAGIDSFESSAQVFITPVPNCVPTPMIIDEVLQGPTVIRRGTPITLPTGQDQIPTEILSMNLAGQQVTIRESPDLASLGTVTQQQAGEDFPALSVFNVNVEVSLPAVPAVIFVNLVPIPMQSIIHSLPPHVFPYLPPPGTCIPLAIKGTPVPVLWMIHAEHKPETNRWCGRGTGLGFIRDLFTGFIGQFSFDASLDVVYGTPGSNTLGDMIEADWHGVWQSNRGPRNVIFNERARTGSPGRMNGIPPTIQSFFDVFHEVSLDGLGLPGVSHTRISGEINPAMGATSTFRSLPPPPPTGPIEIHYFEMRLTSVACTGPYPPM